MGGKFCQDHFYIVFSKEITKDFFFSWLVIMKSIYFQMLWKKNSKSLKAWRSASEKDYQVK